MQDQGWRTAYSDGSGRGAKHAAASHTTSRRLDEPPRTFTQYLGTLASVADAERLGLALSLEVNGEKDMLLLLTDSMAAYTSAINLAKGSPPRSGIESRIKQALKLRQHLDTGISWVRSHIGIPGNEAADRAAEFQSYLGEVAASPNIITHEGLKAHSKAIREESRAQPSFGKGSRLISMWNRRALSAYTWMRTNRGPQLEWLHNIRKTESPFCICGAIQSGDHIVFHCPQHQTARQTLLGNTNHTWESLDTPRYDPDDDEEDKTDLVEEFFGYIFAHFS